MEINLSVELLLKASQKVKKTRGAAGALGFINKHAALAGSQNAGQLFYHKANLALQAGRRAQALEYLWEAVEGSGYWYAPKTLNTTQFEALQGHPAFENLRVVSNEKYHDARRQGVWANTWQTKKDKNLLVALHQSGQNAAQAVAQWGPLGKNNLQVEAFQSAQPAGYGRYRWHTNDGCEPFLAAELQRMKKAGHSRLVLAGQGDGCDAMLRTLPRRDVCCDALLLKNPRLPSYPKDPALVYKMARRLAVCGTLVLVLCEEGLQEEQKTAAQLCKALCKTGVRCTVVVVALGAYGENGLAPAAAFLRQFN